MDAIAYEFLIRGVYQCPRGSIHGADADIFRFMQLKNRLLSESGWGSSQEQKNFEYQSAFAVVRGHIRYAIRDGLEKIRFSVTEKEKETLEKMIEKLKDIHFYDLTELNKIIEVAEGIFHNYGLIT